MLIGGLQKLSLIEYPGKIAAIIFTQGCNFRCSYCHNPELVKPALYATPLSEEILLEFLQSRLGRLQGVSITGGEPTMQKDLISVMKRLKSMGYAVKLDTNGSNPDMLREIIVEKLADYIAMDVKAPFYSYQYVVRARIDTDAIEQSIRLIISSDIPYEFRTTYLEPLLSLQQMEIIAEQIHGCRKWILQRYVPTKTIESQTLRQSPPTVKRMREIETHLESKGYACVIR
jgi:pyruvate formate lyase activating enzyme